LKDIQVSLVNPNYDLTFSI
jgi:hypothetical protein